MPLSTQISMEMIAAFTRPNDMGTGRFDLNYKKLLSLASGVGAFQGDALYVDQHSIPGSGTVNLDFNAGGLVDAIGGAFVPVRLKAILIHSLPANLNDLNVIRPSTTGVPFLGAAGDMVVLVPGSHLLLSNPSATGWAVTAGTGDIIELTNAAATNTILIDVLIVGGNS